jgi:hypothetical protein
VEVDVAALEAEAGVESVAKAPAPEPKRGPESEESLEDSLSEPA